MAKPDWTLPFGVTTSRDRVGAKFTRQASDYPIAGHSPKTSTDEVIPIEVVDRGKRTESDGDPIIWRAYGEGF